MLFVVYVCADVSGEKLNFELAFNGTPSLREFHTRVVEVFTRAEMELGIGRSQPVDISRMVALNSASQRWVELDSVNQLRDRTQVYAFRRGREDIDLSMPLPAPLLPPAAIMPPLMPQPSASRAIGGTSRGRSAASSPSASSRYHASRSSNRSIPLHEEEEEDDAEPHNQPEASAHPSAGGGGKVAQRERTLALFRALDRDADGFITLRDLRDEMLLHQMDVSSDNVGDTFAFGDRVVSSGEFIGFGDFFPDVVADLLDAMLPEPPEVAPPAKRTASPFAPPPPRTRPPPIDPGHLSSSAPATPAASSSVVPYESKYHSPHRSLPQSSRVGQQAITSYYHESSGRPQAQQPLATPSIVYSPAIAPTAGEGYHHHYVSPQRQASNTIPLSGRLLLPSSSDAAPPRDSASSLLEEERLLMQRLDEVRSRLRSTPGQYR